MQRTAKSDCRSNPPHLTSTTGSPLATELSHVTKRPPTASKPSVASSHAAAKSVPCNPLIEAARGSKAYGDATYSWKLSGNVGVKPCGAGG